MTETQTTADPGGPLPERAALAIIAGATFLALVVFTAPLTTLPAMTGALDLAARGQAWVMSSMPLGAACGLLAAGALGDTLGRRRTFVGGLVLTVAASVAAALAPSGPVLIAMRVVQGLGSAGIMACGLGLLGQIYAGAHQRRAAAIWAAALGGGVAAGPILAALVLIPAGWAGIHWLIAVAAAALATAATTRLPESPPTGARVDMIGSGLLMAGLGSLLSALTQARLGIGWPIAGLVAAGAALLALFVRRERRVANPILRLDLFRHGDFTGATLAAFASGAGVLALMSMVPTLLVRGAGLSPLTAAVILLAWSGVTVLSALAVGALPDTLSSRARVVLALLGCMAAQLMMILPHQGTGWAIVLPGLLTAGIANGILNAALGHAAVQSVPADRTAMGSATNNTARYLGSALGIALVSILIAGVEGAALYTRWHIAAGISAAISLAGAAAMLFSPAAPAAPAESDPAEDQSAKGGAPQGDRPA